MFQATCRLTLALIVFGSSVATADDVLELIPKDVLGVVVVSNPQATQGRLKKLGERMEVPVPDLIKFTRDRIGTDAGLNVNRNLAVVVTRSGANNEPTPVFLVPVDDFDALLKAVNAGDDDEGYFKAIIAGRETVLATRNGYAFAASSDARTALQQVFEADGESLADTADVVAPRIYDTDAFLVVTPSGIEAVQEFVRAALKVARGFSSQIPGQADHLNAALTMYDDMAERLDDEFTHLYKSFTLEDGGLRVMMGGALKEGGMLHELQSLDRALPADILGGLPAGPYVFAAGGTTPAAVSEQMFDWSMKMMSSYFGTELSASERDKLAKATAELMRNTQQVSMVMGVAEKDAVLYENTSLVTKTNDARGYLDRYELSIHAMNRILAKVDKPPFSYQVSRQEVDGHDILELKVDMSGFISQQPLPQTRDMMAKMFGESGELNVYIGVLDEQTIVGQYVSRARLLQRLQADASPQKFSESAALKTTLAMLPKRAAGVLLWSPRGIVQFSQRSLENAPTPVPITIPEFPACPPVGIAVNLRQQRLDIDAVVHAKVFEAAAEFGRNIKDASTTQETADSELP